MPTYSLCTYIIKLVYDTDFSGCTRKTVVFTVQTWALLPVQYNNKHAHNFKTTSHACRIEVSARGSDHARVLADSWETAIRMQLREQPRTGRDAYDHDGNIVGNNVVSRGSRSFYQQTRCFDASETPFNGFGMHSTHSALRTMSFTWADAALQLQDVRCCYANGCIGSRRFALLKAITMKTVVYLKKKKKRLIARHAVVASCWKNILYCIFFF
jgi:hypothetical protein